MKKILGLVVSQRKMGNSEVLVKEIMNSIPEECNRELIRLTDLKLQPCNACYRCLQPGKECLIKDDYNFVMNKIKDADAVIIGVPVYLLGPHGTYKMLTDRLMGSEHLAEFTRDKPCVVVMPYGIQGWMGYSQAAALVLPRTLKMRLVDVWQPHAALPGEAVLNSDSLEYAQALGRDLFSGRTYQPGPRSCSLCGSDFLKLLPDNRVECPVCSAQGILKDDNLPDFTGADFCRFSDKDMAEHLHWLVSTKKRFMAERDNLKTIQKNYRDMNWWVKPE